jgi:proton glutamate symport protein
MARTTVNVVGNCLASAVIARWEGELGPADSLGTLGLATPVATAAPVQRTGT